MSKSCRAAQWLLLTAVVLYPGVAAAEETGALIPDDIVGNFASSDTLSAVLFGRDNRWDAAYTNWQSLKDKYGLPLTIGADNWYHANNGGPAASGYGIPGLRNTYYWYVDADPHLSLNDSIVEAVGIHTELRWRETDKFRSYFDNQYWLYENYAYADTSVGRFKAGQIWKRFGLDWDSTWWGDTQYFDGLKLDTAYGVSWENTWHPAANFKIDSFVQYFAEEANISGSLAGANSESVPGSRERNLEVVRVVPTWQLTPSSSLAFGFSGLTGQIPASAALPESSTQSAWAADVAYTWNGLKIFGEIDQSFGVVNPNRYVSGGPSTRFTDELIGASYQLGPATFRIAWSGGQDAHPSGHQSLWVPGVTLAVTKNATLDAEYVRWDATNSQGQHSVLEDGFQLALNWHL